MVVVMYRVQCIDVMHVDNLCHDSVKSVMYVQSVLGIFACQVQDLCFFEDGGQFLSCNDIVGRDSPDRTIMIWDFSSAAVLSNQIFHVSSLCARCSCCYCYSIVSDIAVFVLKRDVELQSTNCYSSIHHPEHGALMLVSSLIDFLSS